MQELVDKLMGFGFTKTDALVYITLLKNGRSSGYKIAKDIALSRSTVYSSIDNLYNNGYIFLSDGDTKEYEAKSPELLFEQIEKQTKDNISFLKKELKEIMSEDYNEFIFNITGYDNLVQKAREVFNSAKKEIYLNTDFNLAVFKHEIDDAVERGVRIIAFSFNNIAKTHPAVEVFSRSEDEEVQYPSRRFMMVADLELALLFSNNSSKESVGLYTNNDLMVKMTAEHIHSDIYLTEYEKQMKEHVVRINSIHEQTNIMYVLGQTEK
uniref:TrmB family transcriptional regulator n=1 Tax=Thaumasiovibrio occultus TaxID=1891184 RepID=UPI000B356103|nr:helix-turn-helix domain-containing protein [Thaumasiovibrio occultus]